MQRGIPHLSRVFRGGSILVTLPPLHVAGGLRDRPESERPLEATLWGEPPLGRTTVRLADGTRISWRRGRWSVDADCAITSAVRSWHAAFRMNTVGIR